MKIDVKYLKKKFNDQKFVLCFTGSISLLIATTYYFVTISPFISSIGLWRTTTLFDTWTLIFILWFISILIIHSLTNPAKYVKYFNPD